MRNERLNYALVGGFVIAMLTAGIAAAMAITGQSGAHDRFTVVFDNIADVKFGTQVRYEGYPVGQVEAISPLAEGGGMRFLLEVSVREGWAIPADSVARIGSSTFLGAKTIEIQRGSASEALTPGARIASAPSADMFAAMAGVAGSLGELLASAQGLIDNDAAELLGSLNAVAVDTRGRVPAITGELLAITQKLNTTLDSVQQLLSQRNVEGVRTTLQNVEEISRQFVEVSGNVQGTLDRLGALVADLDEIVAANEGKVDGALDDTRYTLHAIAENIDAINHNLAGTTRNMNEFSRLIRQNPGLLLGGTPREEVSVERDAAPALERGIDQ